MVYCELLVDGKLMSSNEYFFEPYKNLSLPVANISADVRAARSGFKVTVTTDKLARAVYLSTRTEGFFTENYFDLIPGKPVELQFQTTAKIPSEKFREQLKIRSLKDAFNNSNSTEEVK
jgi:beta-mannosidase